MKRFLFLIILATICSGCSKQLTRDAAANLLHSAQFAKPKTVRVQIGDFGACGGGSSGARAGWNALLAAGWIHLQDESSGGLIPVAMCSVVMSSAAQGHMQQGTFGTYEFLEAIVARPGNVVINGVSQQNKEATVEFSYQMVLTDEGKVLVEPYRTRNAHALMRLYDNGWRIVQVEKPEVDVMEEAFEMTGHLMGDTQFREVAWNPAWAPAATSAQNSGNSATSQQGEVKELLSGMPQGPTSGTAIFPSLNNTDWLFRGTNAYALRFLPKAGTKGGNLWVKHLTEYGMGATSSLYEIVDSNHIVVRNFPEWPDTLSGFELRGKNMVWKNGARTVSLQQCADEVCGDIFKDRSN